MPPPTAALKTRTFSFAGRVSRLLSRSSQAVALLSKNLLIGCCRNCDSACTTGATISELPSSTIYGSLLCFPASFLMQLTELKSSPCSIVATGRRAKGCMQASQPSTAIKRHSAVTTTPNEPFASVILPMYLHRRGKLPGGS